MSALGRRWLAAGGPWREGMRILRRDESGWYRHGFYEEPYTLDADDHPDFTAGATKGAALEWLREAWGEPSMYVEPGEWWTVVVPRWPATRNAALTGETEGEALVAAAEALTGRTP